MGFQGWNFDIYLVGDVPPPQDSSQHPGWGFSRLPMTGSSLKLTVKAPENWCLEDEFSFWDGRTVSFREDNTPSNSPFSLWRCLDLVASWTRLTWIFTKINGKKQ